MGMPSLWQFGQQLIRNAKIFTFGRFGPAGTQTVWMTDETVAFAVGRRAVQV
jgi:hypothetical protein